MEGKSSGAGIRTGNGQRHALGSKRPVWLSGVERVQNKISENPAEAAPGLRPGTESGEYERLLASAREQGRERLALLMETICSTGIRVSEVQYITVEAVRLGRAEIALKGKFRVILLPVKLCRKLKMYADKEKTASGAIFRTKSGKELGRRQIWAELKGLCKYAGVNPEKVFPHNLRHLFATIFYKASKDIVHLADVLGHSSIETTRIYLLTSGSEHAQQLERLGLVT